jgi:Bacteriophage capsid protein
VATGTPDQAAADLARAVEKKWCEWAEAAQLADKLRVMADAEDTDGESFCLFTLNPELPGVQLDLRVIECDRVTTPAVVTAAARFDGILFDAAGNPTEYHVLREHPGDYFQFLTNVWEFERVPASQVVHLFDQERPEQVRGVPLMTPALPLYAILRRYTLANLLTAEAQARINAVIEQENALAQCDPSDPEADSEDGAGEQIYFAGTQMLTLSAGQKAHTLQPSAPGPSYREFKSEVLTEAGRAAGENRNTATGSSAEYNYSSGRLDHLPRLRGIRIRRDRFERRLLDRVFRAWLTEALLVPGYLPAGLPPAAEWQWCWQWDAFESIDPVKDATAQEIRKRNGLSTDADELAAAGKDWREHYRQLAKEKALRDALGLTPPAAEAAPGKTSGVPGSLAAAGEGAGDV